jgi:hypothetical protein
MMESKTKSAAEARFRSLRSGGQPAWTPAETDARAAEAQTARLKAERLARDGETTAVARRRAPAKKRAIRKGVGSY